MPQIIVLDGTRVTIASVADDGISHAHFSGVTDAGRRVFVKVEAEPGRLETEAAALAWATKHAIPVPSVIGYGLANIDESQGVVLITEQVIDGLQPTDPVGWRQMGIALARLTDVSVESCPLKLFSNRQFAAEHSSKLDGVRHLLPRSLSSDIERAIGKIRNPRFSPIFTHGDPGGGNFLWTRNGAVLLDWESATLSPFGLDFGRARFIALLDIQGAGNGQRLADAVTDGYLSAIRRHTLSAEDQFTWSLIAGLQFIFSRWSRRDKPLTRSYAAAIAALKELQRAT